MKFTLEIELGNYGMQTLLDVLGTVEKSVSSYGANYNGTRAIAQDGDASIICDASGNTVGKWEVTDDAATKPHNLTEAAESFVSAIIAQGARVVAEPLQKPTTTALEQLRKRIDNRDNLMDDDAQPNGSRPPNGDDYNDLHQDVIATLEALGFNREA